ncbi:MAG: efflux transporter periplasmic adaptor subunit [Verrucomicrobia bacterium]|nr:MAG: efflux transporter periplasmic adaptor subunit [Verrucomicrobiota bacterium]PYL42831.1 MAG: efflux transporter periplasmic adaptor subunit [Verrucomicrobiota bacterium]
MHDVAKTVSDIPAASRVKSRRKGLGIAIGLLVAIVIFVFGIKALQIGKMMSSPKVMPVTTVTSAPVKEEDWAPMLSAVGSVSAAQGAVVATELGGTISEIRFENGAEAKKGDVLIRLDASQEEALLRSAEAEADLARTDLERSRGLAAQKVVSKAELDAAESKFRRLNAIVDQMRSNIAKKTIVAPFDGQLGIRQMNVGQMINAGQQVVALTSLDRVYVDFALPEQHVSKLTKDLEVRVRADALPGREFKGKLTASNSMVDAVTRNVPLQATLENPDHALRPGMFTKVNVMLPETKKTIVIPGSAVSYAPYGDSVFVIEKQKDPKSGQESLVLRQQFVRIGETRGDFVSVTQGLKAGEEIVGTGVFKLRNGMVVTINNDLAPKPELNPTPADT